MAEKKKMSVKTKKMIYNILMVICIIALIVSLYMLWKYFKSGKQSDNLNNEIRNDVFIQNTSSASDETPKGQDIDHAEIDFEKLRSINSDAIGWLFNGNGVIDYAILQTDNNDYYINHLIDKSVNSYGAIFMDCVNKADFSDRNTLIYGHSMKDGSMFGTLLRYRKQDYYEQYPNFYIYTPEKKYKVEVFSAYETKDDDKAYDRLLTEDDFNSFVAYAFSRSAIRADISVGAGDRLVCLSTCAYSSDNARFIVCGKLVEIN